jgi:hypothetical protein
MKSDILYVGLAQEDAVAASTVDLLETRLAMGEERIENIENRSEWNSVQWASC